MLDRPGRRLVAALVLIACLCTTDASSLRRGKRGPTWEAFLGACGVQATKQDRAAATRAFEEHYKGKEVVWEGGLYSVQDNGVDAGANRFAVKVKMDPTDAWMHDLVLLAPATLHDEVGQLLPGRWLRFAATFERHGGLYGDHVLRATDVGMVGQLPSDPQSLTWDEFRVHCGANAVKSNPVSSAQRCKPWTGRHVAWSGRVWDASKERAPAEPAASGGAGGENVAAEESLVRIRVRMVPTAAWTYDLEVLCPASHCAPQGRLPRTKDFVEFEGTLEVVTEPSASVRLRTAHVAVTPWQRLQGNEHGEL